MTDDLRYCVEYLASERYGVDGAARRLAEVGDDVRALFGTYRNLVNVREPEPVSRAFLEAQDRMLKEQIAAAGITDARDLPRTSLDDRIALWRGDITTLRVDAIVNAANSKLLGCWVPGHFCIDNAIHTFAGVQLRAECDRIMRQQGYPEPTGMAKVTPAYNLPATWVIHTVGPIASGSPDDVDRALLANCYRSCLDAAKAAGAKSIAFCCISTGVFGFPQREAAEIAVRAVRQWLSGEHGEQDDRDGRAGCAGCANQNDMLVVFNVFGAADEAIYRELLFGRS